MATAVDVDLPTQQAQEAPQPNAGAAPDAQKITLVCRADSGYSAMYDILIGGYRELSFCVCGSHNGNNGHYIPPENVTAIFEECRDVLRGIVTAITEKRLSPTKIPHIYCNVKPDMRLSIHAGNNIHYYDETCLAQVKRSKARSVQDALRALLQELELLDDKEINE